MLNKKILIFTLYFFFNIYSFADTITSLDDMRTRLKIKIGLLSLTPIESNILHLKEQKLIKIENRLSIISNSFKVFRSSINGCYIDSKEAKDELKMCLNSEVDSLIEFKEELSRLDNIKIFILDVNKVSNPYIKKILQLNIKSI